MPTPHRARHRLSQEMQSKLRQMIRSMSRDSALYRLLRDELKTLGHWKQAPRGNPRAGHQAAGLDQYAIRQGSSPKVQTYEPVD